MDTHLQPPRSKHSRALRLIAIGLAGLFVLIAGGTPLVLGPIIQRKLESTVTAHLDASLTIGSLTYRPPFTVHLYDVRFVGHPNQAAAHADLLSANQIDLSLAKLPLGTGPLVIERLGIDGLTLHATRNPDGKYAGLDIAKPSQQTASPDAMKLSDVLQLRHFSLKNSTFIYQNQATPKTAPTEWHGIGSEIALTPQSKSLYGFQLNASEAPIAQASVDGTLDVDSLMLQIKQLTASVKAPDTQSTSAANSLPAVLREFVQQYSVRGMMTFTTAATIPLKNPMQASITSDLSIDGGGAVVPGSGETLNDLSLSTHIERGSSQATGPGLKIQLRNFRALSGGAILHLSSAVALVDPASGQWSMSGLFGSLDAPQANHGPWELTGHADFHADVAHDPASNRTPFVGAVNLIGINVRPPGLDAAVGGLTGTIHFAGSDSHDREVDLNNFVAFYGGDKLALDHAAVMLQQFPDRVLIDKIQSHLDLVQDAPHCPGDLGDILQTFQPSGSYVVTGTAAMQHVVRDDGPGYSPEWDLTISTDSGKLALLDERLPVTELKGKLLATKHAISIPSLSGNLLGGTMDLMGNARVVEPFVYAGHFNEHGADVEQFSSTFDLKAPDGTSPSGVANLAFNFFSQSPSPSTSFAPSTQPVSEVDKLLSLLGGDGKLQIDNGNLWALPALESLSHHTRIAREALTAGEAAAVFSVSNQTVYLKHVAIYSPALGLQGSGSETFSGLLNLDIIAAPLGDWKRKLAETDIPFFSRVLSSAAGSLERLVGNATSELLYHFRITGSRDNPIVQTVPAPFLTDNAAALFAKMLHHDGNTKLVDAVNEK